MSIVPLPADPAQWIEDLGKPTWDAYFMSLVFLVAMRSPDQETKQGCVIVDWDTKTILGTGYNGHARGARSGLPTKRPGKYACMVHADTNAAVNCAGSSDHAVVYLPMPPCEVCLGVLANMPRVKVERIVYLEYREFPNTRNLLFHLPHIRMEEYQGEHPAQVLLNAATYANLRTEHSELLSKLSTTTYTGGTP